MNSKRSAAGTRQWRALAPPLTVVALVMQSAMAEIINVPADQPTIQAGIIAANHGDEVVVAPDTYFERINFNGKAITVRSTDPTDPAIVVATIIDGGFKGSVVTCDSNEKSDSVLSGFVIINGSAGFDGGGMRNEFSSPTVTHCTFSGNTAGFTGGGMLNFSSSPTVSNCMFVANVAFGSGGGMYNTSSSPTVTHCMFSGNTSGNGGGMANNNGSSPTVSDCTFTGNSASSGGGMFNVSANPTVTDCTFSGNTAGSGEGGGMYNAGTNPIVSRCTFTTNSANIGGGLFILFNSFPTVSDCRVCSNTLDQVDGEFNDGGGNLIGPYCPPPAAPCPTDFNASGNTGPEDLAIILGNWGPCP